MGRCLAALLRDRCDLMLCSRDQHRAEGVARRVGAKAAGIEECADRHIVFLAVPNAALVEVAGRVSSIMPAGSLLVDISSVKCGVAEAVEGVLPAKVSYISIHPLFASPRAAVKNTVIVQVRPGAWLRPLKGLLESSGMRLKEAGAEEHDRAMAAVQVAHHFALLSFKSTLARMGFPGGEGLEPFMTRSLGRTIGVIGSLENINETIEMIQRENRFSCVAREIFLDEAKKLDRRYSQE
jgi:prephenate dehydrogenase